MPQSAAAVFTVTMKRTLPAIVLLTLVSLLGTAFGGSATASVHTAPLAAKKPVLVLEPGGLGVRVGAGRIRHLRFGTSAAKVTLAVKSALGTGTTSPQPECGQGPRSSYRVKGFSLLLDGNRFVGWTDQGTPGRRLFASDGTGVGITLARLRQLHPNRITVLRQTLGPEFSHAGRGIDGLLSGTRRTSRVTTVFAGETCFFR